VGQKKGRFLAEEVIGKSLTGIIPELRKLLAADSRSCREVWSILRTCNYFGSFLSGQVVSDWTYTSLLGDVRDLYTWAPMGPGSVRGYNRLLGITPITKPPKEDEWLVRINEWRVATVIALGPDYETLTAQDLQNNLCELDKFCRVRNGEGRPRALYKPHSY